MKIAIKNPAPIGKNLEKWGDYHFGRSLAAALEAQGAEVIQHYWPEWDRDDGEDLVIVIRGKRRYRPAGRRRLSVLWVISHPGTVSAEELRDHDRVYVASHTHHAMLQGLSGVHVEVARQCTDTSLFFRGEAGIEARRDINFVANSRGVRREMVLWSIKAEVPIAITGRHWNGLGLKHLVRREYVENHELGEFYRCTRLSLNDHWGDMKHFGYINNRIFDCLACGTPILSDGFPELHQVCGDNILYAADEGSFWRAIKHHLLHYGELFERTASLWSRIGADYSFDARAGEILDWARTRPARPPRNISTRKAAAPHRLAELADAAYRAFDQAGIKPQWQVLHLFPSQAATIAMFEDDRLSYLSADFAEGPWHMTLDPAMAALADRQFDLILIEAGAGFSNLGAEELRMLTAAISTKLKKRGFVVLDKAIPASFSKSLAGFEAHPETKGLFRVAG